MNIDDLYKDIIFERLYLFVSLGYFLYIEKFFCFLMYVYDNVSGLV